MDRIQGIVVKVTGTFSAVETAAGTYRCDLRGRLFRRLSQRLAVGDRVKVTPVELSGVPAIITGEGGAGEAAAPEGLLAGVIEEIEPRRTVLRRARDFKRDQVICANLERVFVMVAILDPPYKRAFVDRLVVGIERDQLEPFLVFNKIDLADGAYAELVREDAAVYERLGYPTLLVSAVSGEGVEALREAFLGRISAVVGPSGVGKSTLLNAIQPGLRLRTGEVSQLDGRGRHTTTAAELVRIDGASAGTSGGAAEMAEDASGPPGYVVDTPGLRAFGLWDVTPAEVRAGFRDVAEVAPECRFRDCAHRSEPGCAVHDAVEAGELDEERFESYLRLIAEVEAAAAERQAGRRR